MGWLDRLRDRPPTRSEEWARSLPPSPLHQNLTSLHALMLHLGAEGDALAFGEYCLREIATYVPIPRRPWEGPVPPAVTNTPTPTERESAEETDHGRDQNLR